MTKEQKLEIVKHSLEEGVKLEDLAGQYKVHPNSISKWRRQYLTYEEASFPGRGNKIMSESEKELADTKKQLRERELEVEILKKALGIFSSPGRRNIVL